jgi:uncharacterized protein involved in response to NO
MEKKSAAKHYKYYPDENPPLFLAYGFRPFLLLIPPFTVISMLLWGLVFSGVLPLPLGSNLVHWHIYELVFGLGFAGICAFMLTALPEMYPGVVPVVGKKLSYLVGLWLGARLSFWLTPAISIYPAMILNLAFSVAILAVAFKPTVLDALQRNSSIWFVIACLTSVQALFFLSSVQIIDTEAKDFLILGLYGFVVLIMLVLRRVNMEVINEMIEQKGLDDLFTAKPFRYNLAVFCIVMFASVEFLYPQNSTLVWLAFACAAAILGVINDFNLKYESIVFQPVSLYLLAVVFITAAGFFALGMNVLLGLGMQNHFVHILSTGSFSLAFFLVMVVIAFIHTGRQLKPKAWITFGIVMLFLATFFRVLQGFYPQYYTLFMSVSILLWVTPFIIYFFKTKSMLLSPRADGVKG